MDYKEKYEHGLECIQEILSGSGDSIKTSILRKRLQSFFPELIESEDEKIRKAIIRIFKGETGYTSKEDIDKYIAWLEKIGNKIVDCPQKHQDVKHSNGEIVMEDFNGGEGFYKLHLDYLSKKQVEEVEEMVRTWNKESKISNENIINCIGMCLIDANEQRFNDYGTTLKDCLDWLKKQCNTIPDECVFRPVAGCDIESAAEQAIKQQGVLAKEVVLAFNGAYIPVKGKTWDIIVNEYNSWLEKQCRQQPSLPKWRYKRDDTPLLRDSLILNKYGCVLKALSGAIISDAWVLDYYELTKLPKEEPETQGEQKPYGQRKQCFDCQFNYAGECKGYCQMKRDEQKVANSSQACTMETLMTLDEAIEHCNEKSCDNTLCGK